MIQITKRLDKNSSVDTTTGFIPALDWLVSERQRININPKRHAFIEEGKTTYQLMDKVKTKCMPDGMLIF